MDKEFKLPDPGEGIHEAEISEILVSEGDTVEEGQDVIVVETDKTSFELPSPYDGTVKQILVEEGDQVRVGDVMMIFSVEGGAGEAEDVPEKPEEPKEKETEEEAAGEPHKPEEEEPVTETGRKRDEQNRQNPERKRGGPIPAAPATRRIARELGVDLDSVEPSGPHGRVTEEDVRAAAEGGRKEKARAEEKAEAHREEPVSARAEAPSLPDFSQWGPVERKPLRSVRRTIAKRMIASWERIPHVTHQDEADITRIEDFRQKHSREIKEKGGSLTLTPFVLKAVVAALKAHPRFNATLDMDSGEIVYKQYYHIGVAVDTSKGLLVPVVRDVDCKSISDLALELQELAERTRDGSVERSEMSGGTFTVSNVGSLGGTGFTPIINYPQSAILGLARAAWRPVLQGEPEKSRFSARLILPLALGFDHRLLDGADAARFTNKIIESLQSPENLVMNL
jgi:pyruvate dehydrogenase E2 component (dihydrolipoamide acetyltransferase)